MKTKTMRNSISFFKAPLMIDADACQRILTMLIDKSAFFGEVPAYQQSMMNKLGDVAVIPVSGILTHKSGGDIMSFLFGGTSYQEIGQSFQTALADKSVKAIVFDIDSPGGEVAGVFDLVDEIFNARGRKPIYAIANEAAYSAAYAIASAADKIFLTRTAGVGSIGILAVHVDQSAGDKAEGLTYNLVYAGAKKIDYSSHAPLSEEARVNIQADVDAQYALFVDTVARNRGMKAKEVRATEAGTFRGRGAVDSGLADTVLSWNQSINKISSKFSRGGSTGMKAIIEKIQELLAERSDVTLSAVLGEMGYIPKTAEGSVVVKEADFKKWTEEAIKQGKAEGSAETETLVTALTDMCNLSGKLELLPGFIAGKIGVEDAKKTILEAKIKDTSGIVRSSVGAVSTGAVNPVVEDAKKRNEATKH